MKITRKRVQQRLFGDTVGWIKANTPSYKVWMNDTYLLRVSFINSQRFEILDTYSCKYVSTHPWIFVEEIIPNNPLGRLSYGIYVDRGTLKLMEMCDLSVILTSKKSSTPDVFAELCMETMQMYVTKDNIQTEIDLLLNPFDNPCDIVDNNIYFNTTLKEMKLREWVDNLAYLEE